MRAELWNDPRAMIGGSDAGAHLDRMCGAPYPTRFLADCIRGRQLIPIERAVQLMTSRAGRAVRPPRPRRARARARSPTSFVFDPETVDSEPAALVTDLPGNSARLTAGSQGVRAGARQRRHHHRRRRRPPAPRRARCCAAAATPQTGDRPMTPSRTRRDRAGDCHDATTPDRYDALDRHGVARDHAEPPRRGERADARPAQPADRAVRRARAPTSTCASWCSTATGKHFCTGADLRVSRIPEAAAPRRRARAHARRRRPQHPARRAASGDERSSTARSRSSPRSTARPPASAPTSRSPATSSSPPTPPGSSRCSSAAASRPTAAARTCCRA